MASDTKAAGLRVAARRARWEARVSDGHLPARERGRIIDMNASRPVSVLEVYLSALIASEHPSLIWGAKEVKRGR